MSWLDEARAIPAAAVVQALGLTVSRRALGPCPTCGAQRRSRSDKRLPMMFDNGGASVKCLACGVHSGGLWLAAAAVFGRAPQSGDDWSRVRSWLQSVNLLAGHGEHVEVNRADLAPVVIEQTPPPPVDQVAALLRCCRPASTDAEVAAYLERRGIPVDAPCGALPVLDVYPDWWPWGRNYPLMVGAYDGMGSLRSCHARAITDNVMGKTRWPRGYAAGWLFLDPWRARPMMQGKPNEVSQVIIVEGLTDYLAAACAARSDDATAVIGGGAGSWKHLASGRVPGHATVYIATDQDAVGERYASEIADALAGYSLRRINLALFATTKEHHHVA